MDGSAPADARRTSGGERGIAGRRSPTGWAHRRPAYHPLMALRAAEDVTTAPLAGLGLVGGYLVARETGIRPLGGVVLGLAGAYAGRTWLAKAGVPGAAALAGVYLGGFGVSHPLAKKVGAWPAVLGVAALSAGASYAVADRRGSGTA